MGRYLDLLRQREAGRDISDESDKSPPAPPSVHPSPPFSRLCRFGRELRQLEKRIPARIDRPDWELAVNDARKFVSTWGSQAEGLGWTNHDVFGLPPIPEKIPGNYRRLARYDLIGLIWILRGRAVVALTDSTAIIRCPGGNTITFRRCRRLS